VSEEGLGINFDKPALSKSGILSLIEDNNGKYTTAIGEEFLKFCEQEVFDQLKSVEVELSDEQIDFIRGDKEIYTACYGTVYPVDARIALNILELRKQLGPDLFNKYKNLAITGAVVRRHPGLAEGVMLEKERYCANGPSDPSKYKWRKFTVVDIKDKYMPKPVEPPPKVDPEMLTGKKKQKYLANREKYRVNHINEEGKKKYGNFLKENNLIPSDTYADEKHRKAALEAMGDDAPISGIITNDFYEKIMVSLKLRPAERDPFPSMADYIKHLDSLDQHRFPLTVAPWPILFPLAKGWPLREAKDIVEYHKDKEKLKTYGKYQAKKFVLILRYKPYEWHYDSWQGKIQAGGVCHQMSTIGVGTLQTFGMPSCKAGKPGHAYLITFRKTEHGYICEAKQGAMDGGRSHWGFADPEAYYPNIYHQGLAASMNVGLNEYMHTRMAVNLANILVEQEKVDLANKVLKSAAVLNPYNTQLWLTLKSINNEKDAALLKCEILNLMARLIKSSSGKVHEEKEYSATTDFSTVEEDKTVMTAEMMNSTYVKSISKTFLPIKPTDSKETNRELLVLLEPCKGTSMALDYTFSEFDAAEKGWEVHKELVESKVAELTEKKTKSKKLYGGDKYNIGLQVIGKYPDKLEERVAWLKKMETKASKNKFYVFKKKGEIRVKTQGFYQCIHGAMVNALTSSNRKKEAQKLKDDLEKELEIQRKKHREEKS